MIDDLYQAEQAVQALQAAGYDRSRIRLVASQEFVAALEYRLQQQSRLSDWLFRFFASTDQLASQQASYVDRGFDLSIASFPLLCLSSDGSRLCPSIAELTLSVPPFALALSLSRTLQTKPGALSRSSTASLVQEILSCQLDIRSLFSLINRFSKCLFLDGG